MSGVRFHSEYIGNGITVRRSAHQLCALVCSGYSHLVNRHWFPHRFPEAIQIDVQAYSRSSHNSLHSFDSSYIRRRLRAQEWDPVYHLRHYRIPRVYMVHTLIYPLCAVRRPQSVWALRAWHFHFERPCVWNYTMCYFWDELSTIVSYKSNVSVVVCLPLFGWCSNAIYCSALWIVRIWGHSCLLTSS